MPKLNKIPVLGSLLNVLRGSLRKPSIAVTGNPDTGIYFPTLNDIGIVVDGAGIVSFSSFGATFEGTGKRIIGDLDNATVANRLLFQTSTVNGATRVGAIPNGTATACEFKAFNNATPTNASWASLTATSSEVRVQSGIEGAGSYLPLTFYVNNAEAARFSSTTRNFGIGTGASEPNNRLQVYMSGAVASYVQVGSGSTGQGAANGALFGVNAAGETVVNAQGAGTVAISLQTSSTERIRIPSSGNALFGTATDNTSGAKYGVLQLKESSTSGIYLGNTANSAASVLDWYEEGTFTPTVAGSSTAGTCSYSLRNGSYTRIGNKVFIHCQAAWTSHTGTGNLIITGLPFASDGAQGYPLAVQFDALVVGAGKQLSAVVGNSSTIYMSNCDVAGGAIAFTAIDAAATLTLSGEYEV
jgi:hypothetical protein